MNIVRAAAAWCLRALGYWLADLGHRLNGDKP